MMLQAPTVEHESIVVHTTTARSVMMENLALPEGRKATVPSTSHSPSRKSARGDQTDLNATGIAGLSAVQLNFGTTNSLGRIATGEESNFNFNLAGDKPRTSTVGFQDSKYTPSRKGYSSTPQSQLFSKSAPPTFANNDSNTRNGQDTASSRNGQSPSVETFNRPTFSVAIVRLRGEVFDADMTHSILKTKTSEPHPLNEFVVPPNSPPFIPPVGHNVAANPNKAKINISFIKGRDSELRNIAETVMGSLFRSVLAETIWWSLSLDKTEKDSKSHQRLSLPFPLGKNYGVYFNEIREPRSLQQRVIIELKHAGYLSYHTPREPDRIE
eukprot:gene22631-29303_t